MTSPIVLKMTMLLIVTFHTAYCFHPNSKRAAELGCFIKSHLEISWNAFEPKIDDVVVQCNDSGSPFTFYTTICLDFCYDAVTESTIKPVKGKVFRSCPLCETRKTTCVNGGTKCQEKVQATYNCRCRMLNQGEECDNEEQCQWQWHKLQQKRTKSRKKSTRINKKKQIKKTRISFTKK